MIVKSAGFNINWIDISNTTGIARNMQILETRIYPNPVTDGIVNVELKNAKAGGKYTCSLYDLFGKLISVHDVNPERVMFQLNLNENERLPAGMYYLNIAGENSKANKLIVVK